ncbi:MAG: S41 family peptidase [Patescibacteria group bacterium]
MQKPQWFSTHFFSFIFLAIILFGAGVFVGYERRPEIDKARGVFHTETQGNATDSPQSPQLSTCVDEKGIDVPCLLDRTGISLKDDSPADFSQFWKAWNVINERFVPTKNKALSNQEKVWGAIAGLTNSLGDPYTYFMPPQEKSIFEQDVAGSFGGVGMQIGVKDGAPTVIAPLKNSPAERAGIMKGDKVFRIDGATTTEMTIDEALYLIRGDIGKPVTLTLLRDGKTEPIEISVVREIIQVPTIETEQKGDIFIIRLYGFPATGAELFRGALRKFVESGSTKLVLDLRGNPGGYLEVAVDIASWFLPQGKVVVSEEKKDGIGKIYRSKGYDIFDGKLRLVILLDGGSASAAEILAGALSQQGVATLVGTKTFGKGSIQELVPITPDSALKVTIAHWITPNGTNLSAGGLGPDIKVDYTKEDAENERDPQLDKAIEILRKGEFPPQMIENNDTL